MSVSSSKQSARSLVQDHIGLAKIISTNLHSRYCWLDREELFSYSLLGLTLAAKSYDSSKNVPFAGFAKVKGMFNAIDQMRKDGLLRRRNSTKPRVIPFSSTTGNNNNLYDLLDPQAEDQQAMIENKDLYDSILKKLCHSTDKTIISLYYSKYKTFKEIANYLDISESTVCVRHKEIIRKLRQQTLQPTR